MNYYSRGTKTGGLKATSSTLCQKCLIKGHYSYECKAAAQERPYVSRPSRTQQLLNPKLVPKLSDEVPQDLLRKKGIADEQIVKSKIERGRIRHCASEEPTIINVSKKPRSNSKDSVSVSTISTHSSTSPDHHVRKILSEKDIRRNYYHTKTRSTENPKTLGNRRSLVSEKKRTRESSSSLTSEASKEDRRSRSTRRKYKISNPPIRGRTTQSKSPHASQKVNSFHGQYDTKTRTKETSNLLKEEVDVFLPRKASLSPFSKRIALTQAMNMN